MQQIQTQKNSIEHFFKLKVMLRFFDGNFTKLLMVGWLRFFCVHTNQQPKNLVKCRWKKEANKKCEYKFWLNVVFFWILTPKPSDSDKKKVYERRDGLFGGDQKRFFSFFLSEILKCFKVLAAIDHHRQHFGEM